MGISLDLIKKVFWFKWIYIYEGRFTHGKRNSKMDTATLVCHEVHYKHIKDTTPKIKILSDNLITWAGLFESWLTLTQDYTLRSIFFSCLKMFFHSNVWCSLKLIQLKTEGQTIYTENLTKKLQNWYQNSHHPWVSLIGLWTTRPWESKILGARLHLLKLNYSSDNFINQNT